MTMKTLGRPNSNRLPPRREGEVAFSLVEMVLALGVVSFCLLTLIGMISVGMNSNRLVREQIIALNLSRQVESDLKATGPTNTSSPLYGINIPAAGASASTNLFDTYTANTVSFSYLETASSQYRFKVTLTGPPTTSPNDPVNAQIQVTWPPQITPIAPPSPLGSNPTNVIGTVNLDVAINRVGS